MRVRLGGYSILPRILDKCRATLSATNGEFNYNCPLDQHFFNFTGINPEAMKAEVAKSKGDGEILEWIKSQTNKNVWEIQQWSDFQEKRGPDSDAETLGYFTSTLAKLAPQRPDIHSWAELLDLDDFVTFGGKP